MDREKVRKLLVELNIVRETDYRDSIVDVYKVLLECDKPVDSNFILEAIDFKVSSSNMRRSLSILRQDGLIRRHRNYYIANDIEMFLSEYFEPRIDVLRNNIKKYYGELK